MSIKKNRGPRVKEPRPDPATGLIEIVFNETYTVRSHTGAVEAEYAAGVPYPVSLDRANYFVNNGHAEFREVLEQIGEWTEQEDAVGAPQTGDHAANGGNESADDGAVREGAH